MSIPSVLTTGWTLLVLMLAIVDGWRVWRCYGRATEAPAPRLLLALLPLSAAMLLIVAWVRIGSSPYDDWSAARTAPAVGWAIGIPLYYASGQGPASDFIYGPVGAVLRLPAALASTPTGAVL